MVDARMRKPRVLRDPPPTHRRPPFPAEYHQNLARIASWPPVSYQRDTARVRRCLPAYARHPMPALTRNIAPIASQLAAMLVLLLPAIWNRFPLLEYDTGGYLARWFEGTLVPSRSTTYGLFLAPGSPFDFWPVVILQAAAAVWIVGVMLKIYRLDFRPAGLLAIVSLLSATTALPFLASELLTDIFAGLALLALHALVWHGERIEPRRCAALVVFIAFAASTHSATYAVLLVLGVAALLCWLFKRPLLPGAAVAHAAIAMLLGAMMLLAGNYAVAKRIAWTPGGYGIAFGRMLQDGIVTRYLHDHCPDPRLKLCPYRSELPQDADDFLWGGNVFDRLGRFDGLGDEMRTIVLESLRDYPAPQLKAALIATARQLVAVGTGEGIVTTIWHTYGMIEEHVPAAVPAMHAARQQNGGIGFTAINAIHVPVALAAMALLPLLIGLGLWSADFADLGALAASIIVGLLANAAFCGVISNPHDRYGSRMVWIAAFAVALAAWRAFALARMRTARSTAKVLG